MTVFSIANEVGAENNGNARKKKGIVKAQNSVQMIWDFNSPPTLLSPAGAFGHTRNVRLVGINTVATNPLIEIRNGRLAKAASLRSMGLNPYPSRSQRTHYTKNILDDFAHLEGQTATVAGRLMSWRKQGALAFAHAEVTQQTRAVDDATMTPFVQGQGDDIAWVADEHNRDFLGNEFLLWLWYIVENETDGTRRSPTATHMVNANRRSAWFPLDRSTVRSRAITVNLRAILGSFGTVKGPRKIGRPRRLVGAHQAERRL